MATLETSIRSAAWEALYATAESPSDPLLNEVTEWIDTLQHELLDPVSSDGPSAALLEYLNLHPQLGTRLRQDIRQTVCAVCIRILDYQVVCKPNSVVCLCLCRSIVRCAKKIRAAVCSCLF